VEIFIMAKASIDVKKTLGVAACFLAASLLSGCMSTPVSSMAKLYSLSPLDAAPHDIRFAVRTPHYLRVRDGDIAVTLAFDTGDTSSSFVEVYKPLIDENARAGQGITIGTHDGTRLTIARFSNKDAVSMRKAQNRIKALRASGVKGKGSLSVVAAGCYISELPQGPVFVSTWLRTSPTEDYTMLTRNTDLRAVFSKAGKKIEQLPSCNE
jgi:hypothetical protein